MTTVGVPYPPREPILPPTKKMPLYSYPKPRALHIAPNVPVFYPGQYDPVRVQTVPQYVTPRVTERATAPVYRRCIRPAESFSVQKYARDLHHRSGINEELRKTRLDWSKFLDRNPERYNIRVPPLPPPSELPYVGYSFRYIQPYAMRNVQHLPRQEPELSRFTKKPVDAFQRDQYKNLHSFTNSVQVCPPWKA